MLRRVTIAVVVALLMAVAALAVVPRSVPAQVPQGPWVDSITWQIIDQSQGRLAVSTGDIDMYIFTLATPADKIAARDDPNINTFEATTGLANLLLNPVAPVAAGADFNPFTIREVREAINWAVDREFIVNEIYGGFGVPMVVSPYDLLPDAVREPAFFAAIGAKYAFDLDKAKAQIASAFSKVPEVSMAADGKWQHNGKNIELIIWQRIEDLRFFVGAYVATQMTALGFTPILNPVSFSQALDGPLLGDPTLGDWHLYTGGWGSSGFVQFPDSGTGPAFFYNGDLGVTVWDFYDPPATLKVVCERLENSDYVTITERAQLLQDCATLGVQDSVRIFLLADADVMAVNIGTSDPIFDLFGGFLNDFTLKTVRKGPTTGGTLKVGIPILTETPWNAWGGFDDVYSVYQQSVLHDVGVATHPHLGSNIPYRADFSIVSVGPLGTMAVPATAENFNVTSMAYEQVGAGLTANVAVTFDFTFGTWHHGMPVTMQDVMMGVSTALRFAKGDLGVVSDTVSDLSVIRLFDSRLKGIEFVDADTAVVWMDTFNPDITLLANRADIWPFYPWELEAVMARSALLNETSYAEADANALGNDELDLAKGPGLVSLGNATDFLMAANFIPAALTGNVTAAEATARWNALDAWRTAEAHFYVGSGPFWLDQVIAAPESTVLTAFRTGYPFDINKWEALTTINLPSVTLGPTPEVIQTFPAVFPFSTSLNGAAYSNIATAAWLVVDPATGLVLFDGDAVLTGAGTWEARLTAEQTTALTEGSFEFRTIVVGAEAAAPVFTDRSFTTLSLASAVLADVTASIDQRLADQQAVIDAAVGAADAANAAAASATNLANTVLILAVASIVVAVVAIALAVVWGRRGGAT